MPTFRKHKGGTEIDGTALSLGIPLLDTIEQINQLNSVLSKWNILLIIKLHPAQDLNGIKEFKCSNIIFLSDERIKRCGTTLYELLAEADALLTDYSSVYYDYLLVDRPIGLIIDDIEEYERRRGIILESYMDSIKGTYIRECRDLEQFIENLAKGYDPDEKIRKWAMNEYCDYRDFKSTERVVDFILEKLNEK
jgi:CDP-glycerol glycerophosphotransferase (TagB/SpsB family)